jgi:YVTN family beta-propeller protein
VHGIAVAPDLNKGFITNRTTNSVTVFDLKSLQKTGEPAVGKNPDAICYDPKTKRIVAMNHSGNDATVIDAKTNEIVATVPLGPAPEFCAADGAGKMYVNLEGSSETLEIDVAKGDVTRRVSLAPSEGPTGLAIDVKNKKLFAACAGSKTMAVIDIPSFKVVATPATGAGADGAGFDSGNGLAFTSNGEGTLTIVKPVNGKYEAVDTVQTERGARTMTVDEKLHHVYLLAAEYGAPAEAKDGVKKGPTPIKPDTFHVLVVGK